MKANTSYGPTEYSHFKEVTSEPTYSRTLTYTKQLIGEVVH
jgi:hypothetical protein